MPAAAPPPHPDSWLHYDPDFVYRYARVPGMTVAELLSLSDATVKAMAAEHVAAP